ncbi:MAG: putative MATE family efflux protein [Paraglaciecola sp.]
MHLDSSTVRRLPFFLTFAAFMKLNTSYKQILSISTPIMLGSAVQILIACTDGAFLFVNSETDFATIGFVGQFYLIVAAIGFGFSRGGQTIIARRMGEGKKEEVGRSFYAMLYFELGLALVMFAFMRFGCDWFFSLLLEQENYLIHQKSLEYLNYRSLGVFFSYIGVAFVALYTGVARPMFIIVDTLVLAVVNFILNYALIFGKWGFPEMGIAGAGLASTIAEGVAFIGFILYLIFDKKAHSYQIFKVPNIDFKLIKDQFYIGAPAVAQAIVGLGSGFVFYSIVENLGQRALAINNLVRYTYMALSIPCWGFASGVNTLVSNFIGQRRRQAVIPIIYKTAKVCTYVTLFIALPFILFPEIYAYFNPPSAEMLNTETKSYLWELIQDAQPMLLLLIPILVLFCFGGTYFNGLTGTGATYVGLKMQIVVVAIYLVYLNLAIKYFESGLFGAWTAELVYWGLILGATIWYLKSKRWYNLKF